MVHYYIIENGVQVGPYELWQLQERYLAAGTPVWCKGMSGWKNAGELPELAPFVHDDDAPPPFKPDDDEEQPVIQVEKPQITINPIAVDPEPQPEVDTPPVFISQNYEPAPPAYVEPTPVQPTNPVNMQQPVDHGGRRCRSSLALSIFALISVFLLYIIFVTSLTYAFSRYESREWLPMVAFMAMLANTVLGIIALVMSIKSRLSFNRQYYEISERRGRTAFILGLIALIIFVIVAGLCIFS